MVLPARVQFPVTAPFAIESVLTICSTVVRSIKLVYEIGISATYSRRNFITASESLKSDGMRMVEREQVDLTRNFLVSLMEEQLEIQQHVMVEVTNQPIVHNGDTLRHMAARIVEEATTVSPRGLAQDVLARAGIDTHLPAEPQVKSGHLRHVGKRARKIARNERKVKTRRAVKRAASRPAVGHENLPRKRARKIAR